jgi:hypothetical protein
MILWVTSPQTPIISAHFLFCSMLHLFILAVGLSLSHP